MEKKKEYAYSSWVKSKTEQKNQFEPKKIDPAKDLTLDKSKSIGSAWNSAGTWLNKIREEKKINVNLVKEKLEKQLGQFPLNDPKWKLSKVLDVLGEVI